MGYMGIVLYNMPKAIFYLPKGDYKRFLPLVSWECSVVGSEFRV